MKCITFCVILCWLSLNSYSQTDTTRKPVDTTKKPLDSTFAIVDAGRTDSMSADIAQADSVKVHVETTTAFSAMSTDEPVYKIKPAVDIPLTLAATGFSLWGFSKIYNKDASTEAQINSLRKSDINGFDRWAADKYSEKAANASDMLFYGSMPAPFLLFIDKKIRKDALKVTFLYWETMSVLGIFYTGTPAVFDRYRPLSYNPAVPMHERTSGNAKNSFFGGHPALVASATFFTAKVYADYNPESNIKWVFYTLASGATLTTAYLRHRAGKHFPSDLIVGTAIGTLNGILVPHFHKNKSLKKRSLSVRPYTCGRDHGVYAVYRF